MTRSSRPQIGVNLAGILGDVEAGPEGMLGGQDWDSLGRGLQAGCLSSVVGERVS